jgi:hypothetical protein
MIIGIAGDKGSGKDTVCKIIQYLFLMKFVYETPDSQEFEHRYIKEKYNIENSGWQKKMFAEKLKQCVCLILGCTMDDLENEDFKNKTLGEEWNCWIIPVEGKYPLLFSYTLDKESMRWIANGRTFLKREMTVRMFLQLLGTEATRDIIHPNIWVNATMRDYKPKQDWVYYPDEMPNWIITDCRFPDNEFKAVKNREGLVIRVENPRVVKSYDYASETLSRDYKHYDDILDNSKDIAYLIPQVKNFLSHFNLL